MPMRKSMAVMGGVTGGGGGQILFSIFFFTFFDTKQFSYVFESKKFFCEKNSIFNFRIINYLIIRKIIIETNVLPAEEKILRLRSYNKGPVRDYVAQDATFERFLSTFFKAPKSCFFS